MYLNLHIVLGECSKKLVVETYALLADLQEHSKDVSIPPPPSTPGLVKVMSCPGINWDSNLGESVCLSLTLACSHAKLLP